MADLSRCPVIPGGANRFDLDREVQRLGGQVRLVRKNGEKEYLHPLMPKRIRFNSRRKTCALHAARWVQQLRQRAAENMLTYA